MVNAFVWSDQQLGATGSPMAQGGHCTRVV